MLGTLRGLPGTLTFAKKLGCDLSWVVYLKERTAWGMRMPREERVDVYGYCIDVLRECGEERGETPRDKEETGRREQEVIQKTFFLILR